MPKRTERVLRLRDEVCHYCGLNPGATLDHIVPDALGGVFRWWNLVPACQYCNNQKGSQWPTCECEKCVAAVQRHMGDPVTRQHTLSVLDRQERKITANARMIREKANELEANVRNFKAYRSTIEASLTSHTFVGKVES